MPIHATCSSSLYASNILCFAKVATYRALKLIQCAAWQSYRQSIFEKLFRVYHYWMDAINVYLSASSRANFMREATELYGDIRSLSMSFLLCTIRIGYVNRNCTRGKKCAETYGRSTRLPTRPLPLWRLCIIRKAEGCTMLWRWWTLTTQQ